MVQVLFTKIQYKDFVKQYSNKNVYIEREGDEYAEALAPAEFEREYIETDKPIEVLDEVSENE